MQKPDQPASSPSAVPDPPNPASQPSATPNKPEAPLHSLRGPHRDPKPLTYRAYGFERSLLGTHIPETIDRMVNANLARGTGGLSPSVMAMAYLDWLMHLGLAPGKQALLNEKALRKMVRLALYAFKSSQNPATPPCIQPLSQDHRFDGEGDSGPIT